MNISLWPRKKGIVTFTIIAALCLLYIDFRTGSDVLTNIVYIVPIIISMWTGMAGFIYLIALICTIFTLFAHIPSNAILDSPGIVANHILVIFTIWLTALLVARITKLDENFQRIVDAAGEGMISVDQHGVIHYVSSTAERILGLDNRELINQKIDNLILPDNRQSYNGNNEKFIETLTTLPKSGNRILFRHKEGYSIPINIHVVEEKLRLANYHRYFIIFRDLTDEEKKETRLQQLMRAVEQSPVSIIITDIKGYISYVNPRFCEVTGYSSDEVIGKNPRIIKSDQTPPDTYHQLWKTVSAGHVWNGIFQNQKKNGDLFWVSATICPVRDQFGDITHYISISEDITDARKKERMLTQALKLESIGRMTNGIAHDFNNLLTVIRGNLKLVQEDFPKDHELRILIDDAMSAAVDGSELIKRLLNFSRRQDQNIRSLNINDNLMSMARILRRTVPDTIIEMNLCKDPVNVLLDSTRLESAILNLITNARDAMPDGGEIYITTAVEDFLENNNEFNFQPGEYVSLSITDTGHGMTEDVRKNALEPFYSTKPIETGTGLGLTMINEFVRQSGGELKINSNPGKGTTVTMFFPSVSTSDTWIPEDNIDTSLPTGKETVLIVEDKEKVRQFTSRVLSRLGYRTYEAENGSTALRRLEDHQEINLLFTDIIMPGDFNGLQLANLVSKEYPAIKVLLTTGLNPENINQGNKNTDHPLLAKPYTAEQLAQSIRAVLDNHVIPIG